MNNPVLNAYEVRNADYSIVHRESEVDFSRFIEALAIADGEKVIDVGGGYGSIFTHVVQQQPQISFEYDLLDSSLFQLRKAEERINVLLGKYQNDSTVRYLHLDATMLDLPANHYDLVI